jgi:hypothetical protein
MEREPILWVGTDKMIPIYAYDKSFINFMTDANGKTVLGPAGKYG